MIHRHAPGLLPCPRVCLRPALGSTAFYAGRLVVVQDECDGWVTVTPMGDRWPLWSESERVRIEDLERIAK